METLNNKTIKLHEVTQGEITLLPKLIAEIHAIPLGTLPNNWGAQTFISYGKNIPDRTHYYVKEAIAEIIS